MSPLVIGLGGGTGAGKSTVASDISDSYPSQTLTLSIDDYYRDRSHTPLAEIGLINYDHPDAIDWPLLATHLRGLLAGRTVEVPSYDFGTHTRRPNVREVAPRKVVILEGILALHDEALVEIMDVRVYVEHDADVRVLRRIVRDTAERGRDLQGVVDQYLATVKPMHEQFVEPSRRNAHMIVPGDGDPVAVRLLKILVGEYLETGRLPT